jgi:dethiobiotin synthetase
MNYFITGIGTDVGKTIASAILVEALKADYWKPIQAGDLEYSDTHKTRALVSNKESCFFEESYRLKHAMSPHAAAQKEGVNISLDNFKVPQTDKNLIIEGAGGLLVPLNKEHCVLDLIEQTQAKVILVSKHYLGSINHTLLSIESLKSRNIPIHGILFNGEENTDTESIILSMTGIPYLGRIVPLQEVNKSSVLQQANNLKKQWNEHI